MRVLMPERSERIVHFPAFGQLTSPTSAISLISISIVLFSPFLPSSACQGVLLVDLRKCQLPNPPLPPLATINSCPCSDISPSRSSVSASYTTQPSGASIISSSPPFPLRLLASPGSPSLALTYLR